MPFDWAAEGGQRGRTAFVIFVAFVATAVLAFLSGFTSAAARAIVRAMRTNLLPVCRNTSAAFLVLATLLLAASAGTVSLAQGPVKGPTVWDGVYTDAQAARATSVFGASCSNCHSLAPDGTGNRPLVGERFWQRNTQKSVGELLAFVSKNMPNGAAAGSLPAATYNDLVALILKSNGLPAGTSELTPDTVAAVQIVPKGGAGEPPANM